MSTEDFSLRREANPIPYWQHHRRAQDSLSFIIRVLSDAALSVTKERRASRIVFVSGEPGTGKSTLYLTLKYMLDPAERSIYAEGYPKDGLSKFDKVRWLDTLDLEVAGDDGENLLASVLVRIIENLTDDTGTNSIFSQECDEAMKKLEDLATDIGIAWEGNLKARAGTLDPDTFSEEVMRTQRARLGVNRRLEDALTKFANGRCFGCDDNTLFVLPVDDFYLKPDASLQLLRLLRMISIPRLFFLVMGDIKTVEALFIEKSLADWTAVAGPELFIHHPDRLDEALTRARELRARYLRKLLPPGQRTAIEVMDWHEALDFAPLDQKEGELTLEHLLDLIELDEPLNNNTGKRRESLHTFLISPSVLSLRAASNAADPEADVAVAKLNESLITKEHQKRQSRRKGLGEQSSDAREAEFNLNKHRSAYTALQILDGTPREIMDIYAGLREVEYEKEHIKESIKKGRVPKDAKDIPILLRYVAETVNLAKEEQSFISEKQQNILEGVLPTRSYVPEDMIFDMDRLEIKTSKRNWIPIIENKIWIRDHRAWDIRIKEDRLKEEEASNNPCDKGKGKTLSKQSVKEFLDDPFAKLPPRQAAWFVLLHDLASKWNPDSLTANLIERLRNDLDSKKFSQSGINEQGIASEKRVDADLPDNIQGWAIWIDAEQKYHHFRLPDLKLFSDLDRFLHIWSEGIRWLQQKPDRWEEEATLKLEQIILLWALAQETINAEIDSSHDVFQKLPYSNFVEDEEKFFEGLGGFSKLRDSLEKKAGKQKVEGSESTSGQDEKKSSQQPQTKEEKKQNTEVVTDSEDWRSNVWEKIHLDKWEKFAKKIKNDWNISYRQERESKTVD